VTKVIEQQGHILQINIITLIAGSKYIFEVTKSLLREVPPLQERDHMIFIYYNRS